MFGIHSLDLTQVSLGCCRVRRTTTRSLKLGWWQRFTECQSAVYATGSKSRKGFGKQGWWIYWLKALLTKVLHWLFDKETFSNQWNIFCTVCLMFSVVFANIPNESFKHASGMVYLPQVLAFWRPQWLASTTQLFHWEGTEVTLLYNNKVISNPSKFAWIKSMKMKIIPFSVSSNLIPGHCNQKFEQKKKDEEPKYSAEIKQLVAIMRRKQEKKWRKKMNRNPTDGKTKKPLKKKKKKEQRKPKQRVDSSPRSSENSDDDDDDPPADGDQDSDSQQSSNDRENKSRSRRPRGSKREEILNWTTCSFSRIGFCEFIYKNIFEGRRSRCNWCGRKGCYVLITWSSHLNLLRRVSTRRNGREGEASTLSQMIMIWAGSIWSGCLAPSHWPFIFLEGWLPAV